MRYLKWVLLTLFVSISIVGCSETLMEVNQAASGISSKANEASTAISADVHSIRAMELTYQGETFTMNDVFKSILRDIQWQYDKENEQVMITGTWKDNGLFGAFSFDASTKEKFLHEGDVHILLSLAANQLNAQDTSVTLQLHQQTFAHIEGTDALNHLYDVYLATH